MATVSLQQAHKDLPDLVKRVLAGEIIVIETGGQHVRLAPEPKPDTTNVATVPKRGRGMFKGEFEVADSFFEPLAEDELQLWEGRGNE